MKCLLRYEWVKLLRACLPEGKGILGHWAKLASRAAFRKGQARYCGHTNHVNPGMWSGGVVGLKSILGVKSRAEALKIMDTLQELGYITYTLDTATKKLEYVMQDWVLQCCGTECMEGSVYATEGYGFLCLPRSIPQRLADHKLQFGEADAWLDLWCHTVWQDDHNVFSFQAPAVQFGSYGAALTLETMGERWGWEKTKVWRFFKKHGDVFALYRLPGSYGCLIFNKLYPTGMEVSLPSYAEIERIIGRIRILAGKTHIEGTDHVRLNKMILWYSRQLLAKTDCHTAQSSAEDRVALSDPIIRAYFSHGWNCKNCRKCSYDCRERVDDTLTLDINTIRGPCVRCNDDKENQNEQTGQLRQQGAL